jgi:hypothetical protein
MNWKMFGHGYGIGALIACVLCVCIEGRDGCIVLGRLISFLGRVCLLAFLFVLSVCLWREKLRILAHAAYLVSYLSACLVVGCTITVAHSNHFGVVCFFVWDRIQKRSREGKVCWKIVMAATQADMLVGNWDGGRERVGRQSKADSKEGSEWRNPYMVLCCGRRDINEQL